LASCQHTKILLIESRRLKFITENWYLILVAITSGGLLIWPLIKESKIDLTAAAAVQLINRERGVLIDVSNADEFTAAHAKGAKNIPLPELEAKLAAVVKKKETPIIFICPMGKRSAAAASAAKKMGYVAAQNLTGGLKAWRDANLPIEKAAA
jgi:rhodanese-related sulfurtransferase